MSLGYITDQPELEHIRAVEGPLILQFGTNWCGYCQRAEPLIREALKQFPQVPVMKVEDGKGRPVGRAFGVKLWPTVVLLADGEEVARVVRPTSATEVVDALTPGD